MPIYDKSVRLLMRDMVTSLGIRPGQVFSKDQVVAWFRQHYPKIKEGTISAHLIRLSTNATSRVHYHARPAEDDVFFQVDGSHFRLYDAAADPAPIREDAPRTQRPADSTAEAEEAVEPPREFAYEKDLRNFLAKHLHLLEPGLHLFEEEGITGIEFPAGGRFVDILALDAQQNYVVIELKVSRGYDRVVGQLLRYMSWIREHQAEPPQKVRGMIVAREISEDLRLACSGLAGVQLFEYELSVNVRLVTLRQGVPHLT